MVTNLVRAWGGWTLLGVVRTSGTGVTTGRSEARSQAPSVWHNTVMADDTDPPPDSGPDGGGAVVGGLTGDGTDQNAEWVDQDQLTRAQKALLAMLA